MSLAKQPVAIPVDQPAVLGTSMRVRLQLTRKQEFTLSHWLFAAHRLRNDMALWLAKRRRVRGEMEGGASQPPVARGVGEE